MTRLLDIALSIAGLLAVSPVLIILYIAGLFDTGSPIFKQKRMGRYKKPFILIKFRTMTTDTASVASHLADKAQVTRFGQFLRRTKLDELPQLWNVLRGEMSLVGPRPNLYNQHQLITARDNLHVYSIRPGITGLAQISEIDMSTPELLARTDAKMIEKLNTISYFRYILMTISGKGQGDRIQKK